MAGNGGERMRQAWERVEAKLDRPIQSMDRLETRHDALDARLGGLEDVVLQLGHRLDATRRELGGKLDALDAKIDRVKAELIGVLADRTRTDLLAAQSLNEDRVARLESELKELRRRLERLETGS